MANDNQTALGMSIQRKKDRMASLELDLLGHHIFGGREAVKQEIQFLKHEITEDEKLLEVEREQLIEAYKIIPRAKLNFEDGIVVSRECQSEKWFTKKYGTDGK